MNIKKGMIFDIKKFAIDDGPGIRTTIFFKGCPLKCWWCHNPEGQLFKPELMHRRNRCIKCGECIKKCPKQVLSLNTKQLLIDRKNCSLCGKCAQKCPTGALTIAGKQMQVNEVMEEIDKDIVFYDESGGGVTISGGEPLMQINFLDELLYECHENNIHTAVDTSGYAPKQAVEKIMDKVDLFLFDIKIIDEGKHKKYTGASNRQILENLKRLTENGNEILVRLPIIPRINDDKDNIKKTAEVVLSNGIRHVYLLPYHRGGIEKYKSLNKNYKLKTIMPPSNQKLNSIKHQLESVGLDVKVGG